MHWFLLIIAIICEALATSALKLADGFTKPLPTIGVIVGYLLSFACFSIAVKTISVSVAYALWCGIGMALVVAASWFWFGQKLDTAGFVGICFIVTGIIIIHLFSKSITY